MEIPSRMAFPNRTKISFCPCTLLTLDSLGWLSLRADLHVEVQIGSAYALRVRVRSANPSAYARLASGRLTPTCVSIRVQLWI
jgi:hypothetical protein